MPYTWGLKVMFLFDKNSWKFESCKFTGNLPEIEYFSTVKHAKGTGLNLSIFKSFEGSIVKPTVFEVFSLPQSFSLVLGKAWDHTLRIEHFETVEHANRTGLNFSVL